MSKTQHLPDQNSARGIAKTISIPHFNLTATEATMQGNQVRSLADSQQRKALDGGPYFSICWTLGRPELSITFKVDRCYD